MAHAIGKARDSGRFSAVPTGSGFLGWVALHPDRIAKYDLARETAAELHASSVVAISDDALDGVGDDPGVMNARISHARLKTDNRKWLASKVLPRRYGDRMQHEHSGNVTISLDTGIRRIEGVVVDAVVRPSSLLDADDSESLLADASDASESLAPSVRAVSLLD